MYVEEKKFYLERILAESRKWALERVRSYRWDQVVESKLNDQHPFGTWKKMEMRMWNISVRYESEREVIWTEQVTK